MGRDEMRIDWTRRVIDALSAGGGTPDPDVVEELAQHARATFDAARLAGATEAEADARASAQIAAWELDAARLRRRSTRARPPEPPPADGARSFFAEIALDLRYAARLLSRQSRHALVSVLTMAFGIGATAVLFGVTYGVLARPLPWPNADRLLILEETRGGRAPRFGAMTNAAYLAWQDQAATIEWLAAWSSRTVTLGSAGDPERIRVVSASASLFPTLGVSPLVGTFFDASHEVAAGAPVIVIGESLWRRRFAADPSVVGRIVHLDEVPHTVTGVLADAQAFPDRGTDAWVPFHVRPATGNFLSMFNALALRRPDVTPEQAAAEGTARGRFAPDTSLTTTAIFGTDGPIAILATDFLDATTAEVRLPLVVLLIGVALLLITAVANVANLHLVRLTTRWREVAIRAALGAGGARIARQLLVESLLLGLVGGVAGALLAAGAYAVLPLVLPADFPRIDAVAFDATTVGFVALLSVGVGVVVGGISAVRLRQLSLADALAEHGTASAGTRRRSAVSRLRQAVMAGQVAVACVLLVAAALLGRSFATLVAADRGYRPEGVLTARLALPGPVYTPERRMDVANRLLDRLALAARPDDVAFTSEAPLTPGGSTSAFTLETGGRDPGPVAVQASPRVVSPHYFQTLGMRVLEGRVFDDGDTDAAPTVVVVNRAFARQYLGDQPLGVRMPVAGYGPSDGETRESVVIGVVDDVRYGLAGDTSQPELFYTHRQMRGRLLVPSLTIVLRTTDEAAGAAGLRAAIREVDPSNAPEGIRMLEDRVMSSLAHPRLYALLLGAFAALALAVAGVGLFGVLSYTVAQRSRELALRSALGARRSDILGLVLRQGLGVAAVGIVAGGVVSLLVMRSLAALLYGVAPSDPATYVAAALALTALAAAASLAPALRASRLDPLAVLKE